MQDDDGFSILGKKNSASRKGKHWQIVGACVWPVASNTQIKICTCQKYLTL